MSRTAAAGEGAEMMALARELYPICRSITGEGNRQTLALIKRQLPPLTIHEVPSGTPVLDWMVPPEWNIREAFIARLDGTRVVDFADHNLHVLQYSTPIDRVVPIAELRQHLHTLPAHPDWIPHRTSYYSPAWGFCLSQRQAEELSDAAYRVRIDSTLAPGHLTYGECVLPGASDASVLISCHICHPSLANDNLSGIVIASMLGRHLLARQRRYTYRMIFIPSTIGSITWLARNEAALGTIRYGLTLSCLGDASPAMTYKQSRSGAAAIDRIVARILRADGPSHRIRPFTPQGYDERQYCSPGFDLPVGSLLRTPNGEYPEYHTSADDLSLLRPESLAHSLAVLQRIVGAIEEAEIYRNLSPKGEPQLGRRGLYASMGGHGEAAADQVTLLWVLNLADGRHSLDDVAERSGKPLAAVRRAAEILCRAGLLERAD
jgi:aminopeptidase-like protein